jgi:hypothetical protein
VPIAGRVVLQPRAKFGAKRFVLGRKIEIHSSSPGASRKAPQLADENPGSASLSSHIKDGIVKVRAIDIASAIVESRIDANAEANMRTPTAI